ncbi:MAG: YihY/virulence factor BrkB family protein [Paracoccaceae bacterium]
MKLPSSIRRAWNVVWTVLDQIDRKNIGLIAAGVAFYAMFSLFPALAALIAIFGLLADPGVVGDTFETMSGLVPEPAMELLEGQLNALLLAPPDALGFATIFSLTVALWSSRNGVASLIRGLNAIFDQPNRAGLRHMAVALSLTVTLLGMAVVAMLLVVVVPVALKFLPLGPWAATALDLTRWLAALALVIVGLGLLYRYGPNRRGDRLRWWTPGALMTVALWLLASIGFSTYLSNFNRYNEVYGSIGAVIALLMWFYITAYLVLLGALLNRTLETRPWAREVLPKALAEEVPPRPAPDRPMPEPGGDHPVEAR